MSFTSQFIEETIRILESVSAKDVESVASLLHEVRDRGGRLFFCGSGGGAAHASHATCDFRKLAGFEAYCATDNVAELTAHVNDEGWDVSYSNWLLGSRISERDCLFVISVGGGDLANNVSPNLVNAMKVAKEAGASITGIAGRDGGAVQDLADVFILIPALNPANITPQTEALQAVFWHLLVTHPILKAADPHWESLGRREKIE